MDGLLVFIGKKTWKILSRRLHVYHLFASNTPSMVRNFINKRDL